MNYKKGDDIPKINRRTAQLELCDLGIEAEITESQIDDHVLLMEDVRTEFAVVIKSALEIYYAVKVKEAKIPKGPNKPERCNTAMEAWKAFKESDVTEELCEKMHSIFFCLDNSTWYGMIYDAMMKMHLWFLTHDKEDTLNQTYYCTHINKNRINESCFCPSNNHKWKSDQLANSIEKFFSDGSYEVYCRNNGNTKCPPTLPATNPQPNP